MALRSTFQAVEVLDVYGVDAAEQHDEDRETDRRLRRGDGQDEEHEPLPRRIAEEMRESDEIHVHREQHQLDRHQQHDKVLAVEEDADDRYREQDRREHEIVRKRYHGPTPPASSRFSEG